MKNNILVFLLILSIFISFTACDVQKNNSDPNEQSEMTEETINEDKVSSKKDESNKVDIADVHNSKSASTSQAEESKTTDDTSESTKENTDNVNNIDNSMENEKDYFTVSFVNYDNKVLKTEKVLKGKSATPPSIPKRYGYKFIKWSTDFENVQVDITTTAIFEEITMPSIIVESADTSAGKTVAVRVSTINNPGVLGILVNIVYDDKVMMLESVDNGSSMSEYVFTPPKNMKSGCNTSWVIADVPEGNANGELMVLHFKILKNAQQGSYPISVTCYGGAVDNNYDAVSFEPIDGMLNII